MAYPEVGRLPGKKRKEMYMEKTTRQDMNNLVQRMFAGNMETSAMIQELKAHPVGELSTQQLVGCVDGIVGSAAYRIQTSEYNLPVVVPAGTGGDGVSTVNITTMAGFVMAASGDCIVPLYGNGKATGKCGKMDVLRALGIPVELTKQQVQKLLKRMGIAPVFAPMVYPGAGGNVKAARVAIGQPTFFNIAMPLSAPIEGNVRLLLGVADESKMTPMGDILAARRTAKAVLVHNRTNRMDEVSFGENRVDIVAGKRRRSVIFHTEEFGIESAALRMLQAGTSEEFARLFQEVLNPQFSSPQLDAIRRVVAMNAACGLYAAQGGMRKFEKEFPKLYERALEILKSGKAYQKFSGLREEIPYGK